MISLIVAIGLNNRVIGKDNKIPWHISEEFAHFKAYTLNKTLIMGDKTFISIGKPLTNRKTIVSTISSFSYDHPDVTITHDLFKTLNEWKNKDEELVVCGGATIYKLALPYVSKMVVSYIKKDYDGDAFFPTFEDDFILTKEEMHDEFIVRYFKRK